MLNAAMAAVTFSRVIELPLAHIIIMATGHSLGSIIRNLKQAYISTQIAHSG